MPQPLFLLSMKGCLDTYMPAAHAIAPIAIPSTIPHDVAQAQATKQGAAGTGSPRGRSAQIVASYRLLLLRGDQLGEQRIAFPRRLQRHLSRARQLVIFPRWALFGIGNRLLLPMRTD